MDDAIKASVLLAVLRADETQVNNMRYLTPKQKTTVPSGKGWMHMSHVAISIDEAARSDETRGTQWRKNVQPKAGLKHMLIGSPLIASQLEVHSTRSGPSTVDCWVRCTPAPADEAAAASSAL